MYVHILRNAEWVCKFTPTFTTHQSRIHNIVIYMCVYGGQFIKVFDTQLALKDPEPCYQSTVLGEILVLSAE